MEWEHASESIRIEVDAVFGHYGQALEPDTMSSPVANKVETSAEGVTSQTTSHSAATRIKVLELPKKVGSSGWTRTSNPPVNRRKKKR